MDFLHVPTLEKRPAADLLILPFFIGKKGVEPAFTSGKMDSFYALPIEMKDFKGKEGEQLLLYPQNEIEKRVVLLGLGEIQKLNVEKLRRCYALLVPFCQKQKFLKINLVIPNIPSFGEEEMIKGVTEGILLANYKFESLKGEKSNNNGTTDLITKACLISSYKQTLDLAQKLQTICEGVYFARDLVNGNADDITPQYLAKVATGLSKTSSKISTTVFDKKRIIKEQMGLLLAVNRGSSIDPALIIVEYKGNPKSKERTVLVGKGITFDTGGLNIKTGSAGMETMKSDMSGAAAALATVHTAERLKLKVNVCAVIPTTENAIGSKSYKPGDVYKSFLGKTVEIGNTDAEGRLILADALAYTVKNLKPSRIIDLATLTGAIIIALGNEAIGLFSNNDVLSDSLIRAGSETFERVWRMPLYEEYREQIKSDVADLKNVGGRSGGAITAAMFLQEFVGNVPWAHLDIAGVAFLDERKRYLNKGATGSPVRLLINFLEHLENK